MKIHLQNRQRAVKLNVAWLREFAETALPECARVSDDGRFALGRCEEVEIAVVSDAVIARVHVDFMGIAGATDVITFEHGEIVMSAQTAAIYAARYRHSVEQELALYTIHGLLHLNGFEDQEERAAGRMRKTQERILRTCLARFPTH